MKKNSKEKKYISIPQLGYLFFCVVTMQAYWIRPVYAVTVWEKASEIMKDVYKQIIGISTIAAIVTAAIALLLMNFSRSGRTVDESRAWLKRIAITWAIINYVLYYTVFLRWAVDTLMEKKEAVIEK